MTHKIKSASRLSALVCTSVLMLTACGPSFKAGSMNASSINSSASNGGVTPTPQTPEDLAWKNLKVEGSVLSGQFGGEQAIAIDKTNMQLVVRLPLPANPYLSEITIGGQIPKIPGATLTLEPGGTGLVLRIPLNTVLRGIESASPSALPNGDPLPKIAAGELPSVAIQLTKLSKDIKATIYAGTSAVGIFVNTPFDPFLYISVPIMNKEGTRTWGYVTSIPAKANHDGGFFVSIALPSDIARLIDDHL